MTPRPAALAATLSLAAAIFTGAAATADVSPQPIADAAAKDLARGQIPGVAVAFVDGGRVAYARGLGVANVETGAAMTADTLLRVGSLTKSVTAVAVVSEARSKHVSLDTPVGRVIPGLAPRIGQVTLTQLLTHTAGFKDRIVSTRFENDEDEADLLPSVRSWKDDDLFFTEPGEVMSYSNLGFVLAGAALEQMSGKRYAEAVSELVLKPVGMHATFRLADAFQLPFAQGYAGPGGAPPHVVSPIKTDARLWPPGFLWASANDYARFAIVLMNHGEIDGRQALDPAAVAVVEQPHVPIPGAAHSSYGFGLSVTEEDGDTVLAHSGRMDGYGAYIGMALASRRAWVVLVNRLDAAPRATLAACAAAAGVHLGAGRSTAGSSPGDTKLEELPGRYVNGSRTITIARGPDGLAMTDSGLDGVPYHGTLTPIGGDRLTFARDGGGTTRVFVVRDAGGRVKYLALQDRAFRRGGARVRE